MPDHQMSSYDLYAPHGPTRPTWSLPSRTDILTLAVNSSGPAFDYLGEANKQRTSRHARFSRSSYFGILDLSGHQKGPLLHYQAHWRPELPMAHILPPLELAGARGTGHAGACVYFLATRRNFS
jgi:beta-galactosidase